MSKNNTKGAKNRSLDHQVHGGLLITLGLRRSPSAGFCILKYTAGPALFLLLRTRQGPGIVEMPPV